MGQRIYYGRLLRSIVYTPEMDNSPAYFRYQMIHNYRMAGIYKAATIDELVAKLRADGHQIWGADDLFSYVGPPKNALEYILMRNELKSQGYSDDEIAQEFSLKHAVE